MCCRFIAKVTHSPLYGTDPYSLAFPPQSISAHISVELAGVVCFSWHFDLAMLELAYVSGPSRFAHGADFLGVVAFECAGPVFRDSPASRGQPARYSAGNTGAVADVLF